MTELHGRTFAAWTALTCLLCFVTAVNLDCEPLYLVTLLSFVVAGGHFLVEFLAYQTMSVGNFTTVGTIAGEQTSASSQPTVLRHNLLSRVTTHGA